MATSSLLGGQRAPQHTSGKDTDSLGPSDSSDSGSDVRNVPGLGVAESAGGLPGDPGADSDAAGTGERSAATPADARPDSDITPDSIVAGTEPGATRRDGGEVENLVDARPDPLAGGRDNLDLERAG